MIGTFDAFQETVSVDKGKHTLRLQVRHDEVSLLEKLKGTVATFKMELPKAISVDVYGEFVGCAC